MKINISGSIAYDEIMNFPHHFKNYFHPEKLHQINVSFAVRSLEKHLGGCATNIAYALKNTIDYYSDVIPVKTGIQSKIHNSSNDNLSLDSRLRGNDKGRPGNYKYTVSPVGAVGKDGGDLLAFFKKNSIDTTCVQQNEKLYTATGKVITDKNNNQIWGYYYGAGAMTSSKLKAESSKKAKEFWIVSATHERPFTHVLTQVIQRKLPYLFDPGMTLTWISDDLLKKGVMNATYLIGNDYEISMIERRLKMTVMEIVKKGVNVITTLGEKGVKFDAPLHLSQKNSKGVSAIAAVKLKKVVDPTGAGDAWRGGFVGALVLGKPLEECLIMGNVMASFAVECVGTVEYRAIKLEIKKRVKSIM